MEETERMGEAEQESRGKLVGNKISWLKRIDSFKCDEYRCLSLIKTDFHLYFVRQVIKTKYH